MRNINNLNYAMVGIPLFLIALGRLFESEIMLAGMLMTMITGGFQLIVGIGMFIDSGYKDTPLAIYLLSVAVFFALWIFVTQTWLIVIPPILALYISVIIYVKAKKEKP